MAKNLTGIQHILLAEQVEEQIYEYITQQDLKSGERLPNEFKLAEKFGVGRSTIREAVKLLVSRGVLETRSFTASRIVLRPTPNF